MSIDEVKRQLKSALQAPHAPHTPVEPAATAAAPEFLGAPAGGLTPYTQAMQPQRNRLARVIAVTSGKGGVGKTFCTVNLALAFAKLGKKVAIFDADLGLANVHILMGVKPRMNLRHMIEDNYELDDIVTYGPEGIKIISGGQGVREMANLTAEQRRVILRQMDRLEREVDILLIDTGAGISENVLRFATFADEIIVVATPSIASAADGYSIIKILLEMEPNAKIGVVANMAQNMYHSKNVFNRINTATQKYLRYSLGDLGYIVNDPRVEASCQTRKPLVLGYPNCEAAKCVRAIADTIMNTNVFVNERKESSFGDLMGALKRTVVGV
jgi:flagellar biosynthesis protein FlhG